MNVNCKLKLEILSFLAYYYSELSVCGEKFDEIKDLKCSFTE